MNLESVKVHEKFVLIHFVEIYAEVHLRHDRWMQSTNIPILIFILCGIRTLPW